MKNLTLKATTIANALNAAGFGAVVDHKWDTTVVHINTPKHAAMIDLLETGERVAVLYDGTVVVLQSECTAVSGTYNTIVDATYDSNMHPVHIALTLGTELVSGYESEVDCIIDDLLGDWA